MNYQIPVSLISKKIYQLIKAHQYSTFRLEEGEFVFVSTGIFKDRLFFVKRITENGLILEDEEEKFYLYLQYSIFHYNPLTREVLIK